METAEVLIPGSEVPDLGEKPERDPLFVGRGLTKIYPSGELEIRALDGVDLDLFEGELVVLPASPAAENLLCSTFSADWMCQPMGR
jgi:hypothetical protein